MNHSACSLIVHGPSQVCHWELCDFSMGMHRFLLNYSTTDIHSQASRNGALLPTFFNIPTNSLQESLKQMSS